MSCTISIPMMTLPESVFSTPPSARVFSTTAVLESEMSAPNQTASEEPRPKNKPRP
jgi:hypothetical protein